MAFNSQPQAVHVDEYLTNYAINYATTRDYIADKIFPVINVEKQSDKYYVFDAENENREFSNLVQKATPRTLPNMFEVTQSSDSYFAEHYFAGFDIDMFTAANEDAALRTRERKARMLMDQMLMKRDRDFISTFMGTGIWGSDLAGGTGSGDFEKWSNISASTPLNDVMKWKEDFALRNYGRKVNTIVLTTDIKRYLLQNAQLLGRINGGATVSNPALINDAIIASVFEVEKVVWAETITNKKEYGETAAPARMLTNQMLLAHVNQDAGMDTVTAGQIFAYNAVPGYTWGITMESFTGDYLREISLAERVHAKMAYDMKVTGASLGTYVSSVI